MVFILIGQLFVKWILSDIAHSNDIDIDKAEKIITEVCTHLIAAGVMKQIVDGEEKTNDEFCVSDYIVPK